MDKTQAYANLDELAHQVGEFIAYWGFKRVHGRLWTHLYLSAHPMDAAQFIQRLGISKALVSMTLADLLKHGVIRPAGKSPRGTDLFEANPDTTQVILNVLRSREKPMLEKIQSAYQGLSQVPELSPDRQKSLGILIQSAQDALESILKLSTVELQAWRKLSAALLRRDS
jgi:DNA-binding transcriptional regulator GbsR (MarR family)